MRARATITGVLMAGLVVGAADGRGPAHDGPISTGVPEGQRGLRPAGPPGKCSPPPRRGGTAPLLHRHEAAGPGWTGGALLHRRVAGKIVLISFIYTNCTDICPLLMHNLSDVQDSLGERFGKDVFFVSISVDPEDDRRRS